MKYPLAIIAAATNQTVTLPDTAPRGTRFTVDGTTWQAVWEGEHFFWERQS